MSLPKHWLLGGHETSIVIEKERPLNIYVAGVLF